MHMGHRRPSPRARARAPHGTTTLNRRCDHNNTPVYLNCRSEHWDSAPPRRRRFFLFFFDFNSVNWRCLIWICFGFDDFDLFVLWLRVCFSSYNLILMDLVMVTVDCEYMFYFCVVLFPLPIWWQSNLHESKFVTIVRLGSLIDFNNFEVKLTEVMSDKRNDLMQFSFDWYCCELSIVNGVWLDLFWICWFWFVRLLIVSFV